MIVRFESSHTGEVLMFASVAKTLLDCIGKESGRRGVLTQPEMLPAARRLQEAVCQAAAAAPPAEDEEEADVVPGKRKEIPVSLGQRAWPLIDMLERTARGGPDAHVLWEAPEDF